MRPLFELQDINTHRALRALPIENRRVFSYIMNNYWETNYKASQDGDFRFRYAITSGPGLTVERAMDFASPWSGEVTARLADIVSVEPAPVRITAFKRAEDGDGYIVRLWNAGDFHGPARLRIGALGSRAAAAERNTSVETPWKRPPHGGDEGITLKDGQFGLHIHPFESVTLRVRPRG
ncbi:MAG: glycosyl hydrolase-related protein [Phycisphaerales bacterium]